MNKLTKKELANIMKVNPRTINNWINKGMPLWYTPGGHTRFDLEEVTTWCDNINKKKEGK